MRPSVSAALFLAAAPCLLAQSWTTFYSAYEDGLAAQKQGDHGAAVRAFGRAIALEPNPGNRVKTYGLNFLPAYHPYLRMAESALALGDLSRAEAALKDSARLGKEPTAERDALLTRLRQAQQAAIKPVAPPTPQPQPAPAAPAQPAPQPPKPVPASPAPAPTQAATVPPPKPAVAAPVPSAKTEKPVPVQLPTEAPPAAATAPARQDPPPASAPAQPVPPAPVRWPLWAGLGGAAIVAAIVGLLQKRPRKARSASQGTNPYQLDFEGLDGATVISPSRRDEDDPNVNKPFGPYTTHKVLGRGGCATALNFGGFAHK